MTKKIAIRYSRHIDHDMIGRTVMILNPGSKKSDEIKHDLNVFFAGECLPYYAAISEEN